MKNSEDRGLGTAEFNNCFIIHSKYFLVLNMINLLLSLLEDFLQNFSLFLRTVSGYKQIFYLADTRYSRTSLY